MTIKTGGHQVLLNGTVIAFQNSPVEFKIKGSSEELNFIFEFKDTDAKDESPEKMEAKAEGPGILRVILTDFRNVLGSGTTRPLKLGTLEGKDIFVHFRVYHLQGSDKTIHYSFYLGS